MQNLESQAKKIINQNIYLTLATCVNNNVWISPLWYAVDKNYNFFFVSENSSTHVKQLMENKNVAFSIYDSSEKPEDVNGLQISGVASEIDLKEIPHALKIIYDQKGAELLKMRFKDWSKPQTYLDLAKVRIYKLVPNKIFILDPEVTDTDKRIEIKLD